MNCAVYRQELLPIGKIKGSLLWREKKVVEAVSSMPEKAFKFKFSKDLILRRIRVGWLDSPATDGVIINYDGKFRQVEVLDHDGISLASRYSQDVDPDQVISIGEKMDLTPPTHNIQVGLPPGFPDYKLILTDEATLNAELFSITPRLGKALIKAGFPSEG